MAIEIKLPALSESINEGSVSEVRVKPGDQISAGDIVVVVDAEKSTVEVPSEITGTITEILVKPGDVVKVGQILARGEASGSGGGKRAAAPPPPAEKPKAPAAEKPKAPAAEPPARVPAAAAMPAAAPVPTASNGAGPRGHDAGRPVPAGPATRRLARKLGIVLEQVPGSGPRGRITQDDVIAFSEKTRSASTGSGIPVPPLPDFARWGPVEMQTLDTIRRKTAEQMALAWSQIPMVTQHDLADITDLENFRKSREGKGPKLTVSAFALKAIAVALKEFPHFNASVDLHSNRLIRKQYYHIGVAVDTDRGLLVPVIRDVDRKTVRQLAAELFDLADRARARKLPLEDLKGGTFTLTNLGGIGGVGFTPIVNWPEVAIMGLSRARLEPVIRDGQVVPRLMMPLSVSYDHRVIDGADGARFTRRVAQMLETPLTMLLDA